MIEIKFELTNNRSVALDNNVIIGFCKFEENDNIWNIISTKVNETYQGQGIARLLVDSVIDNAILNKKIIIGDCSYAKRIIEKRKI